MKLARRTVLAAAIALLVFGAACGDDDDDDGTGDVTPASGSQTRAITPPAGGTPAGAGEALTVVAEDNSFDPEDLDAERGQRVTITLDNQGSASHTLTVYDDEAFSTEVAGADTGQVAPGTEKSITVTFAEAKDYYFRCEVHPAQMQGEIAVE